MQTITKCLLVVLVALTALMTPVRAQAIDATDAQAIEQVIDSQLKAFAADNGAEAYGFAAPIVRQIFPDPGTFMAMVKRGYLPVYRNKSYDFGESFVDGQGRPSQRVLITGLDGKRHEAVYTMEKQADGSWKIAGCYLLEVPSVDA
jgi:hypothetical protein